MICKRIDICAADSLSSVVGRNMEDCRVASLHTITLIKASINDIVLSFQSPGFADSFRRRLKAMA
jgi:hypothetical protein